MSDHGIEVVQRFLIQCVSNRRKDRKDIPCGFTAKANTAGEAERIAHEHIEVIENGDGYINYTHIVEIHVVTLVGRQPEYS
jgi:hypothetical protein